MPFEHFLGRLCEEFHCLPSEAWAEVQRMPVGFLEQVIEYRGYAAAKAVIDRNPKAAAGWPLGELVVQIEFALAQQEMA